MNKIIITLSCILFLSSCILETKKKEVGKKYLFIVTEKIIKPSNTYANFIISVTRIGYISGEYDINLVDSSDKFKIGDTLYLNKIK